MLQQPNTSSHAAFEARFQKIIGWLTLQSGRGRQILPGIQIIISAKGAVTTSGISLEELNNQGAEVISGSWDMFLNILDLPVIRANGQEGRYLKEGFNFEDDIKNLFLDLFKDMGPGGCFEDIAYMVWSSGQTSIGQSPQLRAVTKESIMGHGEASEFAEIITAVKENASSLPVGRIYLGGPGFIEFRDTLYLDENLSTVRLNVKEIWQSKQKRVRDVMILWQCGVETAFIKYLGLTEDVGVVHELYVDVDKHGGVRVGVIGVGEGEPILPDPFKVMRDRINIIFEFGQDPLIKEPGGEGLQYGEYIFDRTFGLARLITTSCETEAHPVVNDAALAPIVRDWAVLLKDLFEMDKVLTRVQSFAIFFEPERPLRVNLIFKRPHVEL